MSKLEEVARAVRRDQIARTSTGRAFDPDCPATDAERANVIAALKALREPSGEMIKAGVRAFYALEYTPVDGDPHFAVECEHGTYAPDVLCAFRAMIDAALAEAKEG